MTKKRGKKKLKFVTVKTFPAIHEDVADLFGTEDAAARQKLLEGVLRSVITDLSIAEGRLDDFIEDEPEMSVRDSDKLAEFEMELARVRGDVGDALARVISGRKL